MNSILTFFAAEGVPTAFFANRLRKASAYHGGAQITKALASTGPGGMLGGMITLLVIQAVSYKLTDIATEQVLVAIIRHRIRNGVPVENVVKSIDRWPVFFGLREKLKRKATTLAERERDITGCSRIQLMQREMDEPRGKEVTG